MGKVIKRSNYQKAGAMVKTGLSVASTALKAYKIAKTVAALVNVEKKYLDAAGAIPNTIFTSTGAIYLLSPLAEGSDYNQRNGNSVKFASWKMRLTVGIGTANGNIRIIIFRDNENRGATPLISELLETSLVYSPLNHTTGKRFTVLRDIFCPLNTANVPNKSWDIYSKMNHHAKYAGAGGTTAECREGNIYIMFLSEYPSGVSAPAAYYYSRLRFIDN